MTTGTVSNSSPVNYEFSPSITLTEHHGGNIVEFDLAALTSNQEITEGFFSTLYDFVQEWTPEQPVLNLYNLTGEATLRISQYILEQGEILAKVVPPNIYGRSAFVFRPSALGHIYRAFIYSFNNISRHRNQIQRKVFMDYDKAMTWLEEML